MSPRRSRAALLVLIVLSGPLAGCLASEEGGPTSEQVTISPSTWIGGVFQTVAFTADVDLSLYVPYLIRDPATQFIQNSTILQLGGETVELTLLAPPRTTTGLVQMERPGGPCSLCGMSVNHGRLGSTAPAWSPQRGQAVMVGEPSNTSWPTVVFSNVTGGPSRASTVAIERPAAPAYAEDQGGRHSTGFVNGRDTYDLLAFMSNEDADPTDLADGAEGS